MTIVQNAVESDPSHSANAYTADGVSDPEFKPLTALEASQWRTRNRASSPWLVVAWQAFAGCVFAVTVGLLGSAVGGWSAAYGALSVVLPSALMVRGLQRQRSVSDSGAVMLGFVMWESVKIASTVAMLVLAPKLVQPLNWLALVAGFVVTMKMYWVAAWLHSRRRSWHLSN